MSTTSQTTTAQTTPDQVTAGQAGPLGQRALLEDAIAAARAEDRAALIAYLLLRLAQHTQAAVTSPLAFARLVRLNLFHRRRLDQLLAPPPTPPPTPRQGCLALA